MTTPLMRPVTRVLATGLAATWTLASVNLQAQDSLRTTMLDNVVVTGQFEPQSLRQSVYQVRSISYDRIRLRAPVNIQSVLSTELGIRFSNDLTLGTSDISLMGMSGQNVKILLDGVPLLDRGATRESLNQIDVNNIERIEIVDGPMSVVYGTDALAGVINIITKKYGDDQLVLDAKVQEETINTEYEPFTGQGVHNENVSLHWQGKTWNAGGSVTRNNSGGWNVNRYLDPQTTTSWMPKDQLLGSATLGFRKNKFNTWYRLNYTDENILSEGMPNANTNIASDKEYISKRFNHQAQADWTISDRLFFNGVASYQDYTRRTRTTIFNATTGERRLSPAAGTQDESNFKTSLVRGMFVHKTSAKVSIQPGFEVNLSQGSGERIDKKRNINDYAGFVSVEYKPVSFVNIRPGLRFIYNSVYDAPPVIPSINTKFTLSSKLDLRAAYARGFRSPALRELYFYFFDASHSIKGNPDLKAEYSNSFTGSLTWQAVSAPSFRMTSVLGGFYNVFEDLIAIGVDPNDSQVNTYVNIAKNKTTGGTLENTVHWKQLAATVGGSYIGSYNTFSDDDTSLPAFLWTPEVNATIAYTFSKIGAGISLYYKYTGVGSYYETATVEGQVITHLAKREAFHMADLSVFKKINKYLNMNGGIRNLFDVTNLRNSTLNTSGAHAAGSSVANSYGRSYFLSLSFHLVR